MDRYCTYIRVSTKKQGASALGMDAQRKICSDYIEKWDGKFVREFSDVESGTHRDRPGLWQAIDFCRAQNCILVFAKLDRLARDVEFTFKVVNTGVQIRFCDMPQVNTMILGVFAAVAQYERELCSNRTTAALNEIKKNIAENGGHMTTRGRWITHLGNAKGTHHEASSFAAGEVQRRRANEWKSQSPLYLWVENQLYRGKSRSEILSEAEEMYRKNPTVYGTRQGCPLSKGVLSKWAKEISHKQ